MHVVGKCTVMTFMTSNCFQRFLVTPAPSKTHCLCLPLTRLLLLALKTRTHEVHNSSYTPSSSLSSPPSLRARSFSSCQRARSLTERRCGTGSSFTPQPHFFLVFLSLFVFLVLLFLLFLLLFLCLFLLLLLLLFFSSPPRSFFPHPILRPGYDLSTCLPTFLSNVHVQAIRGGVPIVFPQFGQPVGCLG